MSSLLCILGPTAAGKTRVAALVAHALCGEVLSADSRQVFRGMDLGTGKDYDDYVVQGAPVPSHLMDLVDPPQPFSLFDWCKAFTDAYEAVQSRERLPVLCGGSGLYLEAVLARYPLVEAPRNEGLREELATLTMDELRRRHGEFTTPHNTTDTRHRDRLVRAIEIALHAHAHPEDRLVLPSFESRIYGVRWPRAVLRRRIESRLKERLDAGLIDEVEALLSQGLTHEDLHFYGLEYRLVGAYVAGDLNRNDMFQKLRSAIHKFAKRQETWFRRMERKGFEIHWVEGKQGPERCSEEIVVDWQRSRRPLEP